MIGLTNPMANKQDLIFCHLVFDCQCLLHSHLPIYLDLPLTASASSYTRLPGVTLDCQSKTKLNSFNKLDHLDLFILKSLALIQKHFLDFFLSLSLSIRMLSPTLLSVFHLFSYFFIVLSLPDLVSFLFSSLLSFIFPHF